MDELLDTLRKAGTALQLGPINTVARQALGSTAEQVLISPPTAAKQLVHHPELTRQEYDRLPQLLATPVAMLRIRPDRVRLLTHGPEDHMLSAVIKTTQARHQMFVLSLHRVRPADVRRYARREELLAGSIESLLSGGKDGAPEGPPTNPS